jgi:photosystem II stability/assembly factor-like uncharacterized protein
MKTEDMMFEHSRFLKRLPAFLILGPFFGIGSSDAQDWEYLGLPNLWVTDVAVKNEDTIYASTYDYSYTGPGFIFRTTNRGMSWDTLLSSVGTQHLIMDPGDHNVMYAGLGSVQGPWGILKTTDGGENWFHADSGFDISGKYWIRSLILDPVHPETLYAGISDGYVCYRTTNGGESWYAPGGQAYVNPIAIDPISPEVIYAQNMYYSGLSKSTDSGVTWEETSLLNGEAAANSMGIDPVNTNILYAGVGGYEGIFRSTNAGETWEEATVGLPSNTGGASIVVNSISREVFAVTWPNEVGVFRSHDLGMTWERMEGLPDYPPPTLKFSRDQTQLYAVYWDLGIYRTTILVSDVLDDPQPIPDYSALQQNYPNPFNPTTTIKYELASGAQVSLKVYDVLGREVLTLVDKDEFAGQHQVVLDASELSSGVYFYRLRAGDFTDTKRLLLLK